MSATHEERLAKKSVLELAVIEDRKGRGKMAAYERWETARKRRQERRDVSSFLSAHKIRMHYGMTLIRGKLVQFAYGSRWIAADDAGNAGFIRCYFTCCSRQDVFSKATARKNVAMRVEGPDRNTEDYWIDIHGVTPEFLKSPDLHLVVRKRLADVIRESTPKGRRSLWKLLR